MRDIVTLLATKIADGVARYTDKNDLLNESMTKSQIENFLYGMSGLDFLTFVKSVDEDIYSDIMDGFSDAVISGPVSPNKEANKKRLENEKRQIKDYNAWLKRLKAEKSKWADDAAELADRLFISKQQDYDIVSKRKKKTSTSNRSSSSSGYSSYSSCGSYNSRSGCGSSSSYNSGCGSYNSRSGC